jgi:Protein of unknown function (DUF3168)
MSSVPIYQTLNESSSVKALLGTPPTSRIYGWGQAPADVVRPYVVWQLITGSPENNLSDLPGFDSRTVQVDVYASTAPAASEVAIALRDAIEPVMHITSWDGESRDHATNDYRVTFSVDWFVAR